MRKYEDPQHHFQRRINRDADRYVDGLNRAGMKPSPRLTRAMAERAANNARADYEEQTYQTFQSNIHTILSDYRKRDRQIKREGARMAWMTCPFGIVAFGVVAWYNFRQGAAAMGLFLAVGALAFLAMLVIAQVIACQSRSRRK